MTDQQPAPDLPEIPLINEFITYRLTSLMHSLNRASTQLYAQYDLSVSDWQVLLTLHVFKEMTATDLTKLANVDKGLISRIVKKLSERGYIAIQLDQQDGRRRSLSLTPAGEAKFHEIYPLTHARDGWLKQCLNPTELNVFLEVTEKLFRQINTPFIPPSE